MSEPRWHVEALEDAQSARDWYAERSPSQLGGFSWNKELPLPVSAACASAILAGRKSMARYIAGRPPGDCPFGKVGDLLWVAEPWANVDGTIHFKAVAPAPDVAWQSSRSMPREITRVVVRLVASRLERLQDISTSDVAAEGDLRSEGSSSVSTPIEGFARWWDSTHRTPGTQWADNPIVWALTFERVAA